MKEGVAGGFRKVWRIGRSLWDKKGERTFQKGRNTTCWAGASHSAGLGRAGKFPETSGGRLERELRSVTIGIR